MAYTHYAPTQQKSGETGGRIRSMSGGGLVRKKILTIPFVILATMTAPGINVSANRVPAGRCKENKSSLPPQFSLAFPMKTTSIRETLHMSARLWIIHPHFRTPATNHLNIPPHLILLPLNQFSMFLTSSHPALRGISRGCQYQREALVHWLSGDLMPLYLFISNMGKQSLLLQ